MFRLLVLCVCVYFSTSEENSSLSLLATSLSTTKSPNHNNITINNTEVNHFRNKRNLQLARPVQSIAKRNINIDDFIATTKFIYDKLKTTVYKICMKEDKKNNKTMEVVIRKMKSNRIKPSIKNFSALVLSNTQRDSVLIPVLTAIKYDAVNKTTSRKRRGIPTAFIYTLYEMSKSPKTRNSTVLIRKRRNPIPLIGRAVGFATKYSGIITALTAAGAASTVADVYIRDHMDKKAAERLSRKVIDCDLNNVGCIDNMCWTNCGPRLTSADWCLTTKNATAGTDWLVAKCVHDEDCNPCWKCATTCIMENASNSININILTNDRNDNSNKPLN